jgi:hypothetical protein
MINFSCKHPEPRMSHKGHNQTFRMLGRVGFTPQSKHRLSRTDPCGYAMPADTIGLLITSADSICAARRR